MSVKRAAPTRALWAERVAYSNGILLDEADFEADQNYHRGRMSILARYLNGTGTICGLNVETDAQEPRRITISPGLGLDRAGRVIQSPLPLCLSIDNWYADLLEEAPQSAINSFRAGSGGSPDHLIADVFLGFRECEISKRPAFENASFDALGSVTPLRTRDAVEATLTLRTEDNPPLPRSGLPTISGANRNARLRSLDAAKRNDGWLEDVWWDDFNSELSPDIEHPTPELAPDIFLARILIPATEGEPPELAEGSPLLIENEGRRMVYSTADLIALGS